MKSVQKIDLGLTGYDELFMNDAERKENKLPRIYDIPLSEIDDFPDHPFKVKLDEDMSGKVCSCRNMHRRNGKTVKSSGTLWRKWRQPKTAGWRVNLSLPCP